MEKIKKIQNIVCCPNCQGGFDYSDSAAKCNQCKASFDIGDNVVELFKVADYQTENEDSLVFKVKSFFKKFPRLYQFIIDLVGPPEVSQNGKKFIKHLEEDKVILNIGSGPKIIRPDVINIDIYPYKEVNLTANAVNLPILDNSVDAVICESLLEHVQDPYKLIDEIYRILKPGGKIWIMVPFMLGFHSSPNDFRRWTHQGLSEIFGKFENVEVKSFYGPTSAVTFLLGEWLAILLSFNIKKLYQFWMLMMYIFQFLLLPLRLLDYILVKYPYAKNISYGLSIIGNKKNE